ncbi:mitochondrial import receptor subunit tom-20 [Viridothelium virens]|uniref:Mitochondrial import receptor subunit TOM20 n=1 Tax=Viridothelium virens TaxID=1048519 RepID=A0A6A6GS66_VIRVR|nr:mitochondrial import receptor subunit tom-20 [Viridothelium virens]
MSSTPSSSVRTSTIIAASVGLIATGLLGYALYFDHRRRTDPEFRKTLKRESRKMAKAAKEDEEKAKTAQKQRVREVVDEANEEGFPKDAEETEAYFMSELAKGEGLAADSSDPIEAALCFYKALKVYPQPRELISIYDKTVPKPILDLLAEMIAVDSSISISGSGLGSPGSMSAPNLD